MVLPSSAIILLVSWLLVVDVQLCVTQILQAILINGQFPGPTIEAVTNDNIVVDVINKLDEPFLITWSVLLLEVLIIQKLCVR